MAATTASSRARRVPAPKRRGVGAAATVILIVILGGAGALLSSYLQGPDAVSVPAGPPIIVLPTPPATNETPPPIVEAVVLVEAPLYNATLVNMTTSLSRTPYSNSSTPWDGNGVPWVIVRYRPPNVTFDFTLARHEAWANLTFLNGNHACNDPDLHYARFVQSGLVSTLGGGTWFFSQGVNATGSDPFDGNCHARVSLQSLWAFTVCVEFDGDLAAPVVVEESATRIVTQIDAWDLCVEKPWRGGL